ncbi:hypothetical protein PN36_05950 [Candidatus Thiomargarita nelsonii]|uniref:Uncharacterized protein n=1 Tax=Candidatus Thiomargarita nelsonii TaxID=1003181 RepID=A0A0A6P0F4_9GAMM|nr:hypothetical protein PN36_05950 [Candidatus Thiomargarita nelsonii]
MVKNETQCLEINQWRNTDFSRRLITRQKSGSGGAAGSFAPPEKSLRRTRVTNYGEMILENKGTLPTIVPLHLGYFQNAAQNHAMCVSALLAAGKSKQFKDACCIQAAQGGYIFEPMNVLLFSHNPCATRHWLCEVKRIIANYGKILLPLIIALI